MRDLRDVVVPVDFGPASYRALEYARELAAVFGARLHLLHVLEDVAPVRAATDGHTSTAPPRDGTDVRERLNRLLTDDEREAGALTVVRVSRDPGTAIVAYAGQVDAGTIVIGTHWGNEKRLGAAIGAVAECVVRSAPCPVRVVRQRPQQPPTCVERAVDAVVELERAVDAVVELERA